MQKIIDAYDDISIVDLTLQPVKSSLHTVSSLLELGTDTIEEAREDLRVTSGKERELELLKLDIKIAKAKEQLNKYQDKGIEL